MPRPVRRATLVRLLLAVLLLAASPAATARVVQAQDDATLVALAEDTSTQVQTVEDAYNLLMDRYVHQLDSAALLSAGWEQLRRDATDRKAPAPGGLPGLDGDRAADLDSLRGALSTYLAQPGFADGWVPAHSIVRGMVRFVDDGHTFFLDHQQYTEYQSWSRGEYKYAGIGVSVSARGPEPRISEVYEGTPAAQAGLHAGDVLVQINGQSVAGRNLDELSAMVRGPAGTTIQLTVRRAGEAQLLSFTITRAEIRLEFVKQKLIGDDIGYVLLRGFPEPSVVDTIERDITRFREAGVRGMVLDLRGNPGGRVDVGTRLLSHFLPAGTSVYEEVDRTGRTQAHYIRSQQTQYDLPLVVLVDAGTASMGEIFASAVQEHGVATVLGTSTAGSVAAAQVFALRDGSGLQVTVFDILSSQGKKLNQVGVTPDEVLEADPATLANGEDPVLSRAIEILHAEARSTPGSIGPSGLAPALPAAA